MARQSKRLVINVLVYTYSVVDKVVSINNGKLCKDIIDTYQNDGIILEPDSEHYLFQD